MIPVDAGLANRIKSRAALEGTTQREFLARFLSDHFPEATAAVARPRKAVASNA